MELKSHSPQSNMLCTHCIFPSYRKCALHTFYKRTLQCFMESHQLFNKTPDYPAHKNHRWCCWTRSSRQILWISLTDNSLRGVFEIVAALEAVSSASLVRCGQMKISRAKNFRCFCNFYVNWWKMQLIYAEKDHLLSAAAFICLQITLILTSSPVPSPPPCHFYHLVFFFSSVADILSPLYTLYTLYYIYNRGPQLPGAVGHFVPCQKTVLHFY